jgi:hypothetical protein
MLTLAALLHPMTPSWLARTKTNLLGIVQDLGLGDQIATTPQHFQPCSGS